MIRTVTVQPGLIGINHNEWRDPLMLYLRSGEALPDLQSDLVLGYLSLFIDPDLADQAFQRAETQSPELEPYLAYGRMWRHFYKNETGALKNLFETIPAMSVEHPMGLSFVEQIKFRMTCNQAGEMENLYSLHADNNKYAANCLLLSQYFLKAASKSSDATPWIPPSERLNQYDRQDVLVQAESYSIGRIREMTDEEMHELVEERHIYLNSPPAHFDKKHMLFTFPERDFRVSYDAKIKVNGWSDSFGTSFMVWFNLLREKEDSPKGYQSVRLISVGVNPKKLGGFDVAFGRPSSNFCKFISWCPELGDTGEVTASFTFIKLGDHLEVLVNGVRYFHGMVNLSQGGLGLWAEAFGVEVDINNLRVETLTLRKEMASPTN